jgi:hypothetical protein
MILALDRVALPGQKSTTMNPLPWLFVREHLEVFSCLLLMMVLLSLALICFHQRDTKQVGGEGLLMFPLIKLCSTDMPTNAQHMDNNAIADLMHNHMLPFTMVECTKFIKIIKAAKTLGTSYFLLIEGGWVGCC